MTCLTTAAFFARTAALYIISGLACGGNAHVLQSEQPRNEPSNGCLDCICQAVSSCNISVGCNDGACGMFRITRDYWIDSDQPVLNEDDSKNNAYERCANDPKCARQSATNYLTKFAQDCNGDGTVDCGDYAAIHVRGPNGCAEPLDADYKRVYENCMYSALYGGVFGEHVSPPPSQPSGENGKDNIVFLDP